MDISKAINIDDQREIARRRAPRFVFEYLDGGAEDQVALRANQDAFTRLRFRPRTLLDVSTRSVETTLLGSPSRLPVILGPMGLLGLFWRDGDMELARAASAAGVPYALSTVSMSYLEDVARDAPGRLWFQCYVFKDRAVTHALLKRAAAAGYETLIITSDIPVSGKRERCLRTGLLPHQQFTLRTKLDILMHPRWLATVASRKPRFVNIDRELGPGGDSTSFIPFNMFDPALDWDDFKRFRDGWKGKLLLKGVLRADDAARAVELGADGVVVSNHGGRQLDGAISGIDALPDIAAELRGRAAIIVDGGIRRGSDIAKAIALGAGSVILGRAVGYGIAAGGAAGATRALDILREEFDRTLALTGCRSVADLSPDLLTRT
jgi:(S)-mandelate dehydrogenase